MCMFLVSGGKKCSGSGFPLSLEAENNFSVSLSSQVIRVRFNHLVLNNYIQKLKPYSILDISAYHPPPFMPEFYTYFIPCPKGTILNSI